MHRTLRSSLTAAVAALALTTVACGRDKAADDTATLPNTVPGTPPAGAAVGFIAAESVTVGLAVAGGVPGTVLGSVAVSSAAFSRPHATVVRASAAAAAVSELRKVRCMIGPSIRRSRAG